MPFVSYMPYYPDRRVNKTIGGFQIWNWQQYNQQMVPELAVREYLESYFGLFRLPNDDPEQRISIISRVGQPTIPATEELAPQEIAHFTSAVMACHLFNLPLRREEAQAACSSDNFVAFYKEFDPRNVSHVSFTYGSYVRMKVFGSWDHIQFTTPQYMPDPAVCHCEEDLLLHLSALCVGQGEQLERIFRSLEWLRLAFANYDWFEYQARIVTMTTAFETLLDFAEREKGRYFADTVNTLIPPNRLPTTTRIFGTTPVADNDVGWWCRDFYGLRSRIVHGETIRPQEYHHPNGVEHLRIALSIFEECIWGLLVQMGRIRENDRRRRFRFRPTWREQLGLPDNVWYPQTSNPFRRMNFP